MCDAETRRQRRIVKMVTLISMEHASSNVDRRFFQCLGASSKIGEFAYPQSLLKSVMFRPPSFFYALFALFRPLVSQKVLDKQAFCPGRAAGGAAQCPFASKHFELASLPTILGGECRCEERGGCFCGMSNDATAPSKAPGEAARAKGWLW